MSDKNSLIVNSVIAEAAEEDERRGTIVEIVKKFDQNYK